MSLRIEYSVCEIPEKEIYQLGLVESLLIQGFESKNKPCCSGYQLHHKIDL
ncbi:MAG: hypothetical protein ACW967_04505 [Candidatus Hodarchaeales archaeon]